MNALDGAVKELPCAACGHVLTYEPWEQPETPMCPPCVSEQSRTRDGRNRFHSAMSRVRRAALESLLLPVDHPDLWPDAALERMYAERLAAYDRSREQGVEPPEWARAASHVRFCLATS